jgi:two-component system, OmpR family, response regulator MprA
LPQAQKPAPKPKVLIVDDDPDLLDSLRLVLELSGFAVITAENGVRGLQAFRNVGPAAVVIDVIMPKLDGIEAVRQMRREGPEAKIIVMSGSPRLGKDELSATARELGAVASLEKPFDPVVLTGLLRDLLPK